MSDFITLNHGSGGRASQDLIRNVFIKSFGEKNVILSDAAVLSLPVKQIAFSTDSFVIDPVFFPGGDIGKLAICGTVNDLAVSGAVPKYLTASFILEEGYSIKELRRIVESMSKQAQIAGISIVTGDTKVVPKGKCDKLFINTAGIGVFEKDYSYLITGQDVEIQDKIIINGFLGDHSMAVLRARNEMAFKVDILSDCTCLNHLIQNLMKADLRIRFMRDVTRGGLATVLNELADMIKLGIEINEKNIPVRESVKGLCEMLGFDPLYLANEGKFVLLVHPDDANEAVDILKNDPLGKESAVIGEIAAEHPGVLVGKTNIGGRRIINMLQGEQLPRIC